MTMLPRLQVILEASGILLGEQTYGRIGLRINLLFNLKAIALDEKRPDPELAEACDTAIKLAQAERQRLKDTATAQPPPAALP